MAGHCPAVYFVHFPHPRCHARAGGHPVITVRDFRQRLRLLGAFARMTDGVWGGRGYQRDINQALREYIEGREKKAG
jgi:hypothetical protein